MSFKNKTKRQLFDRLVEEMKKSGQPTKKSLRFLRQAVRAIRYPKESLRADVLPKTSGDADRSDGV